MSALTSSPFDTLRYVKRLKEADVPEKQAEAQAEALREVLADQSTSQTEVSARIVSESDTKTERAVLKLEGDIALVRKDMDLLRKELGSDIALVRKDIDNIRWAIRLVLGGIVALLLKSFLS